MNAPFSKLLLSLCLLALGLISPGTSAQQLPDKQTQAQSSEQTQQKTPPPVQKKTDIEKKTGTVNDRLFEAMPNYVVEDAKKLPALKPREKFGLAGASVFDPFTVPFVGFLAAMGQASNSPPSWGQGWAAYGKRFGAEFGDNGIGSYMTIAIFPTILKEDPRYYVIQKGTTTHRVNYALKRLFVTYTDSGATRFNYSEILGNAAAAAASNIYHAPEDRTVGRNLSTWGMLIMWDGISNQMKEFWPDIRRKVFHKRTP